MVGLAWLWFGVLCQTVSTDAASGMEYVLFTSHQSWNTARKVCRGYGGHLAILDTEEQLARIRNLSEGVWEYESQYRWVGLQVNQSTLLWEGTCEEQDLSNASLSLFASPEFNDGQCFVLKPWQHVLYDHPCDHRHPFICQMQAQLGVSINNQSTTRYMEAGHDSKTPHECEPVDDTAGQTTAEMDQTTQATSVPSQNIASVSQDESSTSPAANDTLVGGMTSSPANVTYSVADETSSPANDNLVDADETSSPANDNLVYTDETSSPANDNLVDADGTSSPANDNLVDADETSSSANDNLVDTDETSSPANDNLVDADETSATTSPANKTIVGSDDITSPTTDHYVDASSSSIVSYSIKDDTSSPANGNSGTTGSIIDTADNTPRTTGKQVCIEYNIPVLGAKELRAVLAAIAKELSVDKKNLSKRIRKKVSAQDHRVSARSIGYVAVFIISIPVFVILVLDIPRAVQQIRYIFFSIKANGRPTRTAKLVERV